MLALRNDSVRGRNTQRHIAREDSPLIPIGIFNDQRPAVVDPQRSSLDPLPFGFNENGFSQDQAIAVPFLVERFHVSSDNIPVKSFKSCQDLKKQIVS